MCVVCVDWASGKLTSKEALNNLGELISSSKTEKQKTHYLESVDKILETEVPMAESDEELNQSWYDETYE